MGRRLAPRLRQPGECRHPFFRLLPVCAKRSSQIRIPANCVIQQRLAIDTQAQECGNIKRSSVSDHIQPEVRSNGMGTDIRVRDRLVAQGQQIRAFRLGVRQLQYVCRLLDPRGSQRRICDPFFQLMPGYFFVAFELQLPRFICLSALEFCLPFLDIVQF